MHDLPAQRVLSVPGPWVNSDLGYKNATCRRSFDPDVFAKYMLILSFLKKNTTPHPAKTTDCSLSPLVRGPFDYRP
jgi:hypothetical protein